METLKPCPFCGGEAEAHYQKAGYGNINWIRCIVCGCETGLERSLIDAVEVWNRRWSDGNT